MTSVVTRALKVVAALALAGCAETAAAAAATSVLKPPPLPPPSAQGVRVVGVWEAHRDVTAEDSRALFADLASRGYRVVDVSAVAGEGGARIASVWQLADGAAWEEHHELTAEQLARTSTELSARGARLARVSASQTDDGARFAAIWEAGDPRGARLEIALDAAALTEELASAATRGERLADLAGYDDGAGERFVAAWEPGDPTTQLVSFGVTRAEIDARLADVSARSWGLQRLGAYAIDGQLRYVVLGLAGGYPSWLTRTEVAEEDFQLSFDELVAHGLRLVQLSAVRLDGRVRYTLVWNA